MTSVLSTGGTASLTGGTTNMTSQNYINCDNHEQKRPYNSLMNPLNLRPSESGMGTHYYQPLYNVTHLGICQVCLKGQDNKNHIMSNRNQRG